MQGYQPARKRPKSAPLFDVVSDKKPRRENQADNQDNTKNQPARKRDITCKSVRRKRVTVSFAVNEDVQEIKLINAASSSSSSVSTGYIVVPQMTWTNFAQYNTETDLSSTSRSSETEATTHQAETQQTAQQQVWRQCVNMCKCDI